MYHFRLGTSSPKVKKNFTLLLNEEELSFVTTSPAEGNNMSSLKMEQRSVMPNIYPIQLISLLNSNKTVGNIFSHSDYNKKYNKYQQISNSSEWHPEFYENNYFQNTFRNHYNAQLLKFPARNYFSSFPHRSKDIHFLQNSINNFEERQKNSVPDFGLSGSSTQLPRKPSAQEPISHQRQHQQEFNNYSHIDRSLDLRTTFSNPMTSNMEFNEPHLNSFNPNIYKESSSMLLRNGLPFIMKIPNYALQYSNAYRRQLSNSSEAKEAISAIETELFLLARLNQAPKNSKTEIDDMIKVTASTKRSNYFNGFRADKSFEARRYSDKHLRDDYRNSPRNMNQRNDRRRNDYYEYLTDYPSYQTYSPPISRFYNEYGSRYLRGNHKPSPVENMGNSESFTVEEPFTLFLQRSPPPVQDYRPNDNIYIPTDFLDISPEHKPVSDIESGIPPVDRHTYHQLFYPRLLYHLKYVGGEHAKSLDKYFHSDIDSKYRSKSNKGPANDKAVNISHKVEGVARNNLNVGGINPNGDYDNKLAGSPSSYGNGEQYYDGNYNYDQGEYIDYITESTNSPVKTLGSNGNDFQSTIETPSLNITVEDSLPNIFEINVGFIKNMSYSCSDNKMLVRNNSVVCGSEIAATGAGGSGTNTVAKVNTIPTTANASIRNNTVLSSDISDTSNSYGVNNNIVVGNLSDVHQTLHYKTTASLQPATTAPDFKTWNIRCSQSNHIGCRTFNGTLITEITKNNFIHNDNKNNSKNSQLWETGNASSEIDASFYNDNLISLEHFDLFYNRNLDLIDNRSSVIYNSDIVHPHQQQLQLTHQLQQQLPFRQQKQQQSQLQQQKQQQNNQDQRLEPHAKQLPAINNNEKSQIVSNNESVNNISNNSQKLAQMKQQQQLGKQQTKQQRQHEKQQPKQQEKQPPKQQQPQQEKQLPKSHQHHHHHHALLPPSLQLPPPSSLFTPPLLVPAPPPIFPPTQPTLHSYQPPSKGGGGGMSPPFFDFGEDGGTRFFQRPLWGYWHFW